MGFDLLSVVQSIVTGTTAVPKSIAKFIDTVSGELSLFCKPHHIQKEGEVDTYLRFLNVLTDIEIQKVKAGGKIEIKEIKDRAKLAEEARVEARQRNREAITAVAASQLPDSVSDEPVDPDWTSAFFDNCKDISNEEMQILWGKILAGEVAKPGSFSRRALEVVKSMSVADADLYTRFCSAVWYIDGPRCVTIEMINNPNEISSLSIEHDDIVCLEACGLIKVNDHLGYGISLSSQEDFVWNYFDMTFISSHNSERMIDSGRCLLTPVGMELFPISGAVANEAYLMNTLKYWKNIGWQILLHN